MTDLKNKTPNDTLGGGEFIPIYNPATLAFEAAYASTFMSGNVPHNDMAMLIGDSRPEQNGSVAAVAADYTDPTSWSTKRGLHQRGWAYWIEMKTGGRVRFPIAYNYGVGSLRTDHVLDRMSTYLASPAAIAIVLCGSNDRPSSGQTLTQSKANITSIVTQLLRGGKWVILINEPPRIVNLSAAEIDDHLEYRDHINSLRDALGVYGSRFVIIDPFDVMVDPTLGAPTTGPGPRTDYTTDGLHISARGAEAIAALIAPVITQWLPARVRVPYSAGEGYRSTRPGGNVLASFTMIGSSANGAGGVTGNRPSGWTMSRSQTDVDWTCATSVPLDTNGYGAAQWDISAASAAANLNVLVQQNMTDMTKFDRSGSAYYFCGCQIDVSSGYAGLLGVELQVSVTPGSVHSFGGSAGSTGQFPSVSGFSGLIGGRILVPSNMTSMLWTVYFYMAAGASRALTGKVSRPTVRKVSGL